MMLTYTGVYSVVHHICPCRAPYFFFLFLILKGDGVIFSGSIVAGLPVVT